jgi:para-nitrobenzyl esterase
MTRAGAVSILLSCSVLVSAAGAQPPAAAAAADLGGTSWQLVAFRGGDGEVLRPDDGLKYTLAFGPTGQLVVRLDCNRGRGTWKSSGAGRIEIGPLALTRALCSPESLHDRILRLLGYIASYRIKDGRLFLSLMADGGVFEFAPVPPAKPRA